MGVSGRFGAILAAAVLVALPAAAACPPPAGPAPAAPAAQAPRGPLTITFFGVSTLAFDDGQSQLLVDGYFTRPGPVRTVFTPIGASPKKVRDGLAGAGVTRLEALLTAHAHHDHALDTAEIARQQPAATVVGDAAVAALAVSRGTPPQRVCTPVSGQAYAFGPYRVTAWLTPHGRNPWLLRKLLDGKLTRPFAGAAWFGRYRDDQNLAFLIEHDGRRILVHPSAGRPAYDPGKVDVLFLGLAQLGRRPDDDIRTYWRETAGRSAPDLVVPIHWDDFTRPLDRPLKPPSRPFDDVDGALRILRAEDAGRTLCVLPARGRVVLPGPPPACDRF